MLDKQIIFTKSPIGKIREDISIDTQTASQGQTEFTATFKIRNVYKNNMIVTSGISGLNTTTITFAIGLNQGDEIYITN